MKFITKDGKLLGIINIVDLFVLIIICALLGYGTYKILYKNPQTQVNTINLVLKFELGPIRSMSVEAIHEGDKVWNADKGYYLGKIIEKKVESYMQIVANKDGKLVLSERPGYYRVVLKIECINAVETETAYTVNGIPVQIGSTSIAIKTKYIRTRPVIIGIEKSR